MRLRTATTDDIALLTDWNRRPHVTAAFGADALFDWNHDLTTPNPAEDVYIAEVSGKPLGVIIVLDPGRDDSDYWGDIGSSHRAVDLWIAEADRLRQGLGSKMLRLALYRCFADPSVVAVLADPLLKNQNSVRFFRRHGFQPMAEKVFEQEPCVVMRLERRDWNP